MYYPHTGGGGGGGFFRNEYFPPVLVLAAASGFLAGSFTECSSANTTPASGTFSTVGSPSPSGSVRECSGPRSSSGDCTGDPCNRASVASM